MFYTFAQWIDHWWQKNWVSDCSVNGESYIRFWLVAPNSGSMSCGLITESRDAAGRPAPVLCTIKGSLPKKARRNWEKIDHCCLAAWNAMREIMRRRFASFSEFKTVFSGISPPDFEARPHAVENSRIDSIREEAKKRLTDDKALFIREKMLCFPVDPHCRTSSDWHLWMQAVKDLISVMPASAFLRNADEQKKLYLYYRPLVEADFQMMQNN
ncbi:MAG: hypothetical protein ACOC0W_07740 [Desulfosalsimonas sp.]